MGEHDPGLPANGLIPTSKIVNGTIAFQEEFSFAVFLYTKHKGNDYLCGGVIYDSIFILTTAHCFYEDTLPQDVSINAGKQKKHSPSVGETILAEQIYIHENYSNPFPHDNDIAIILLSRPLKFSSTINAVEMPKNEDQKYANEATVVGWGRTGENSMTSDELIKTTIPLVPDMKCKSIFKKNFSSDLMICAGGISTDSCYVNRFLWISSN